MRKILPKTPDMDTQMNLVREKSHIHGVRIPNLELFLLQASKMIDRRTSTPKGYHSYGPFFLEYSLLAEYNLIRKQKMPGVYVIPSSESPLCKHHLTFALELARIRTEANEKGDFHFRGNSLGFSLFLLCCRLVWSRVCKAGHLPGGGLQVQAFHPRKLPRRGLPGECLPKW